MNRAHAGSLLRALLAGLLLGWGLAAAQEGAEQDADLTRKRADLRDVQQRIQELDKAIADTETSRLAAADRLAASERAVSAAQRRLRQLADERETVEGELARSEARQREVAERVAQRQEELAAWLRRYYMHGGNDVAPLLSARDPNQLARDAHYLALIARARAQMIAALRADLAEQTRLREAIASRRDRLVVLEAEQRGQRDELAAVKAARAEALAALVRQLEGQQRQANTLREDERRLASVLEVLARQAAEREAARVAAQRRAAAAREAARVRSEAAAGEVRRLPRPAQPGARFAELRGKIGLPVRGELLGRFGAQRAEGGTRWRGVFIRARSGDEVLAVAAGEVVFSDWLRGYGNLIIIDHGEDYLTVYGNNDALFKIVGDRVGGGTPIASVGTGVAAQESGLYFEIRHKGEPVDPMQWVRNR